MIKPPKYSNLRPVKTQALLELSNLCDNNNVYILPRNGLLLGAIRHKGFLPNECIDLDVTALQSDVDKIKQCDWNPFELNFIENFGWNNPGRIGNMFFDGVHPITGKKINPSAIVLKYKKNPRVEMHGSLLFDYIPGYVYQPWIVGSRNYKKELAMHEIYHQQSNFKTGAKILGENEKPLSSDFLNTKKGDLGWGKVGKKYKLSDWNSVRKVEFYHGKINVPSNAKEILIEDYGYDCLDVMLTKRKNGWGKTKERLSIPLNESEDLLNPMKI